MISQASWKRLLCPKFLAANETDQKRRKPKRRKKTTKLQKRPEHQQRPPGIQKPPGKEKQDRHYHSKGASSI